MKTKGQKVYITQGDSFDIPFKLVATDEDVISKFDPTDKIVWVLRISECCKPLLVKEITGVNGTQFTVSVSRNESRQLHEGRYEYGVFVESGTNNRLTIVKPTDFIVERGV